MSRSDNLITIQDVTRYSINYSNNGCLLSSCNLYTDVLACSTCLFVSKTNLSSFPSCPSSTDLTASTTTLKSTIMTHSITIIVSTTFLATTTGFHYTNELNPPTMLTTYERTHDIIVNNTLCVSVCNYGNQTMEEFVEMRKKGIVREQNSYFCFHLKTYFWSGWSKNIRSNRDCSFYNNGHVWIDYMLRWYLLCFNYVFL